jgi:drug/metabolite transporter (DMT)-like permease
MLDNNENNLRTVKQPTEENNTQKVKKLTFKLLILLQAAVCIYTVSGIAGKFASRYDFLSLGFILCYGVEIIILGVYAIIWQQIIKKVDISIAYANRAVAIFWSMLWAVLIFKEPITVQNLIGVAIIFLGTWMVNRDG